MCDDEQLFEKQTRRALREKTIQELFINRAILIDEPDFVPTPDSYLYHVYIADPSAKIDFSGHDETLQRTCHGKSQAEIEKIINLYIRYHNTNDSERVKMADDLQKWKLYMDQKARYESRSPDVLYIEMKIKTHYEPEFQRILHHHRSRKLVGHEPETGSDPNMKLLMAETACDGISSSEFHGPETVDQTPNFTVDFENWMDSYVDARRLYGYLKGKQSEPALQESLRSYIDSKQNIPHLRRVLSRFTHPIEEYITYPNRKMSKSHK